MIVKVCRKEEKAACGRESEERRDRPRGLGVLRALFGEILHLSRENVSA